MSIPDHVNTNMIFGRKSAKSTCCLHFPFDHHHDVRTRTTTQDQSHPQRKNRQDNVTTCDNTTQVISQEPSLNRYEINMINNDQL